MKVTFLPSKGQDLCISDKLNRRNSALVQCELYRQLINKGYEVYPEIKVNRCRFDLVVCNEGKFSIIIECKDSKRKRINIHTRQHIKYIQFGIPVVYCLNLSEMENIIPIIENLFVLETKTP